MHIIVAFNIAACCRCCCCCHGCAGCTMTMYLIAQQTQTIGFRVSCVASALCYVKRHERTRQTNIWIERRNAGFGGWTRLVQHSLRTLVAFYFFFLFTFDSIFSCDPMEPMWPCCVPLHTIRQSCTQHKHTHVDTEHGEHWINEN